MKKDSQFWMAHAAAIEREGISVNAYAKREGVSLSSMYYWNSKASRTATKTREVVKATGGAFVQLRMADNIGARPHAACTLVLAAGVRLEMAALPAPEWLASVARATQGVA